MENEINSTKQENNNTINWFETIGDDLCEYILSYLTFEEKIRVESVCKQFQQLVYNKQFSLFVDKFGFENRFSLNKLFNKSSGELNLAAFESVLKKCKNLNSIVMYYNDEYDDTELIKLITNNCIYLKKIGLSFTSNDKKVLHDFGKKFAKNLQVFHVNSNHFIDALNRKENIKSLLWECVQLKEFKYEGLDLILDSDPRFLPKLENLNIKFKHCLKFLKLICDKYNETLKFLKMDEFFDFRSEPQIDYYLLLSRLKNLTEIKGLIYDKNEFLNLKSFKTFALNCKKLKTLWITLRHLSLIEVIHYFEHFENLQEICLFFEDDFHMSVSEDLVPCLHDLSHNTYENNSSEEFVCQLFKNCKKLKWLKIISNVNEKFLKDIDLLIPQLESISLFNLTQFNDSMAFSLSKLKNLKQLGLEFNNSKNDLTCKLFKDCKQLNFLHLYNVSEQFFTDIDIHIPNLEHVCYFPRNQITDSVLYSLSKLKHIKHIAVNTVFLPFLSKKNEDSLITDSSFLHLINTCKTVKSINLYPRPKFSRETNQFIIKQKPFIDMCFYEAPLSSF